MCHYDSIDCKSNLCVRAYIRRGKSSKLVVVLRVVALKYTKLVAVAIDAPVENKPYIGRWNYKITEVIQNNTVCFELNKIRYKTSRRLK